MQVEELRGRLSNLQNSIRSLQEEMEKDRSKIESARMNLYQAETENRRKAQELYGASPSVRVVGEYTEYVMDERGI